MSRGMNLRRLISSPIQALNQDGEDTVIRVPVMSVVVNRAFEAFIKEGSVEPFLEHESSSLV